PIGEQADDLAFGIEHRTSAVAVPGAVDAHLIGVAHRADDRDVAVFLIAASLDLDNAFADGRLGDGFQAASTYPTNVHRAGADECFGRDAGIPEHHDTIPDIDVVVARVEFDRPQAGHRVDLHQRRIGVGRGAHQAGLNAHAVSCEADFEKLVAS